MADEAKLTKATVTNITDGPKVVNAVPVITLQAGECADVEIIEAEFSVAKGTEWFEFGKKAGAKAADATE